jgi:hypothetical protein
MKWTQNETTKTIDENADLSLDKNLKKQIRQPIVVWRASKHD